MQRLKEQGRPVPFLDNMPQIMPEALPYWQIYCTLGDMRFWIDGAPQPIQFTEIAAYMDHLLIREEDEQDDVFGIVRVLDRIYLDHIAAERKKREDKQPDGPIPGRNRPVRRR